MPRKCVNHPNIFCYVCGSFTTKSQRRTITSDLRKIYKLYFDCPLGDQDKAWAPHIVCTSCFNGLRDWLNKRKVAMPFAIPMIWREPKNHHDDCYFCSVNVAGFTLKTKHQIVYPNLQSAIRPIPHCENLPVPKPSETGMLFIEQMECEDLISAESQHSSGSEYTPDAKISTPQTFTQEEINDLIRDLSLSKEKSELLASRIKEKNILERNVKVSFYRERNYVLKKFFTVDGPMVFCNDVNGLFRELKEEHNAADWRHFIDSSARSLNTKPSIPIAHSFT